MTLPVMPSGYRWFRGGPVLSRAGRSALYASDKDTVVVWDEETGLAVTDLRDATGQPMSAPTIKDGWIDGAGLPSAVRVASFSVGASGKRYEMVPVQTLIDAAASLAPTDTQVSSLLGNPASATRVQSDGLYAPKTGSTAYAPATGSTVYPSAKNPSGVYQIALTNMWNRLDDAGATIGGDGTVGGALEVYTQISATGHDLAMLVHGHADIHFSRAAPSSRCQTLTITGSPTGGTFTLTYGGQTTAPLAYNCTGPQVASALKALSSVSGDVYVYSGTGGPPVAGGPFTITMAMPNPTAITATSSLTGGTSPGVTITQTTPDGMAYFDIPIGGNIQVVGQFIGKRSTGHIEFKTGGTGGAFRFLDSTGTTALMSVNNAGVFALGSVTITGNADLVRYFGGGSSGGMAVHGAAAGAGTGTNGLIRFRDNDTDSNTRFQIDTAAPPSGRTAIAVQYHNGTAVAFQYATVGAADSGGAGFRVLRVPN